MNRKTVWTTILLLATAGCPGTLVPPNTGPVYKPDFPGYTPRSSPITEFGAGTVYSAAIKGGPAAGILLAPPEGLFADGMSAADKAALLNKMVVPGRQPGFKYDFSNQKSGGLSVAIPQLSAAIGGGGSLDLKNGVTISISCTSAANNLLNWIAFSNAMDQGKIDPHLIRDIKSGKTVMVFGDITATGYTVSVKVNTSKNADLNLALKKLANGARPAGGAAPTTQPGVTGSCTETSTGNFSFTATEPVIVEQWFASPPVGSDSNLLLGFQLDDDKDLKNMEARHLGR